MNAKNANGTAIARHENETIGSNANLKVLTQDCSEKSLSISNKGRQNMIDIKSELTWAASVLAGYAPTQTSKMMVALSSKSPVLHAHLKSAIKQAGSQAGSQAGDLDSEPEAVRERLGQLLQHLEVNHG